MKAKANHLLISLALGLILALLASMDMVPTSAAPAAQAYHVDASSGSDILGDGTPGNPWKTMTTATLARMCMAIPS